MTLREKINKNFVLQRDDVKSRLLSRSLLWMGLGLAIITLVAFLSATLPVFQEIMLKIALNQNFMLMSLFNILLMVGIFMTIRNPRVTLLVPVSLYALFALYEGVFVSATLFLNGMQQFADVLLVMLVPAIIFGVMGMVAYTNVFDFTKLIPFATFGIFALMLMSLIMAFVGSGFNQRWLLVLAAGLFIIWIGIDLQLIKNAEENLETFALANEPQALNRLAFMFGLRLFVDFVNLVLILIRLLGR